MPSNQKSSEGQHWWRVRSLGRVYNHLGYLDWKEGHYGQALQNFRRALRHFTEAEIRSERANTLNNLAFTLALLGESSTARQYVDEALRIRSEVGQRYWIALSLNTRGYIDTLEDHPMWGERDCRQALEICEQLEQPRGIGLACIGIGFALRRRGNQWRLGVYSEEDANAFFGGAVTYFQRTIEVFSNQVHEPLRLWEAHNELGSLYCDWAWLTRQRAQAYEDALEQYEKSIEHQRRALDVAETFNWTFQIADSLDDLAQAQSDRGFLLNDLGRHAESQKSHSMAEDYLNSIEGMVPDTFRLVSGKGFQKTAKPGEAYLLSLGKANLQRGAWIFRRIMQQEMDGRTRERNLREAIWHFAIATAYFQQYWPRSYNLIANSNALARRLQDAKVPAKLARAVVRKVAAEFKVNLDSVSATIDNALGV